MISGARVARAKGLLVLSASEYVVYSPEQSMSKCTAQVNMLDCSLLSSAGYGTKHFNILFVFGCRCTLC